jgi:hypothetical protein
MMRSLVAAGLYLISSHGIACDLAGSEMVELETGVTLHYRIDPSPLPIAQHFSMPFLVCRGGQPLALDSLELDALMPTHGHGMNYKANIEIQHDGLIEATGMLLHLPGPWQISVDLSNDDLARQIKIDYQL